MEARSRTGQIKTPIDESTDDFEVVRQSRLELMTLRKQRRKIEVMTEQLSALQQMYVEKVEENMNLRAENTRLANLGELYESEKDELLEQIELLKEKTLNNSQQMEHMYYTIEQLKKFLADVKRSSGPDAISGAGKQEIIDKMAVLQSNVADLTHKLNAHSKRKSKQEVADISHELRSERNAVRTADQRVKLLQYQVDRLKQQNSKLTSQKEAQGSTIKQMRSKIDQLQEEHSRTLSELNLVTFKRLDNQSSQFTTEPRKQYIEGMSRTLSELKCQELQKIEELIDSHSMRSFEQGHS